LENELIPTLICSILIVVNQNLKTENGNLKLLRKREKEKKKN